LLWFNLDLKIKKEKASMDLVWYYSSSENRILWDSYYIWNAYVSSLSKPQPAD